MSRVAHSATVAVEPVDDPAAGQREWGADRAGVVAGGETIRLADPATAWLIGAGRVDIFAVEFRDGRPVGRREFLCARGAGDVLLGAAPAPGDAPLALLALAGDGARLDAHPIRALRAGAVPGAPEFAGAVDGWIAALSDGLAARVLGHAPTDASRAAPPADAQLVPGRSIVAHQGVVWARVRAAGGGGDGGGGGAARFAGAVDVAAAPPGAGPGGIVALTPSTWIEGCGAGGVELEIRTTADVLGGDDWRACLARAHEALLAALARGLRRLAEVEDERLRRRAEHDEAHTGAALHRFAGVLHDDRAPPAARRRGPEEDGDLLFQACQAVAAACGLKAVAPPRPRGNTAASGRGGPSLDDIARASGFRTRQVALRGDWWRGDFGPLLVWREEDRRPMALVPARRGRGYRLHDPAEGTVVALDRAVAGTLSGIGNMFYPPLPDRRLGVLDLLRFGAPRCRRDFAMVLATAALGGLVGTAVPVATAHLFNIVIPAQDRAELVLVGLMLVVVAVALAVFKVTGDIAMLRAESRITVDLTAALWDRLLRMPNGFYADYSAGDLAARTMAVDAIRQTLVQFASATSVSGMYAVFSLGLLFLYVPAAAAVAALLFLLLAGATLAAGIKQLRDILAGETIAGRLSGMVLEIVSGISRLRLAGAEERAFARWGMRFAEARRHGVRAQRVAGLYAAFVSGYEILALAAVFAAVAFGRGAGLDTGSFLAVVAAFTLFLASTLQVARAGMQALTIQPLIARVRPILATLPERSIGGANPGDLTGAIEVNHVHFRYGEDLPWVLHGVSIQARPGAFIAVVGGSGSGKSTLMKLLLGFESPQAGSIYFDGQDMRGLDLQAVRRQIGVVLQNDRLLPGSIYENIVGATGCTVEAAWEAARQAGLARDIEAMPMGLHTVLTEGSTALSGGQVQRLLIARALVAKPPILLFDEATSALDNRTQAVVTESLDRLAVTRVVIAHRLSTVARADRIYVMGDGRVLESGTYEELMAREGAFAELARRQLT